MTGFETANGKAGPDREAWVSRPGNGNGSIQSAGHDVYDNEMPPGTLLNNDVELLLTGNVPDDESLAGLAPVVASLRAEYRFSVSETQVVEEGAHLAAAARRTAPATVSVQTRPHQRRSLRRKLVPVLAAAALLGATTGAAYAVEDSLPGDSFYGLKRAFETVGLLSGGVEARIAEAQALFDAGKTDEALAHIADAAGSGSPVAIAAAEGLKKAAEALRANEQGSQRANDVREQVADRLDWMSTTDETGRDFGQGVSEQAPRQSEPGSNTSNRSENANENAADPTETGPPDHARQPDDAGPPDHAGGPGGPENEGNSETESQGSGGSGGKPTDNQGQGGGKPDKKDKDS